MVCGRQVWVSSWLVGSGGNMVVMQCECEDEGRSVMKRTVRSNAIPAPLFSFLFFVVSVLGAVLRVVEMVRAKSYDGFRKQSKTKKSREGFSLAETTLFAKKTANEETLSGEKKG